MLGRYRRKSFVKHRGADDIEDGYVYGMASVVTPKQHLREYTNEDFSDMG